MPVNEQQAEHAALADELGEALREAGPIALKFFRGSIKSWIKGHDSPVSEADIAVDEFLRARLWREGFGWLSEESQDDRARLNFERLFIVDPIDGTRSYLKGREDWSIVAAIAERGRPVAAALYVPVSDELFLAARGRGATRNGVPIMASAGTGLANARIAGPKKTLDKLTAIDPATIHEPKIFSLALRIARVAQGQVDAAFASVNARDWDLAAADLLVHEAGGAITNLAGEALIYNLHDPVHGAILAAGRERHAAMLDLVRERQKDFA